MVTGELMILLMILRCLNLTSISCSQARSKESRGRQSPNFGRRVSNCLGFNTPYFVQKFSFKILYIKCYFKDPVISKFLGKVWLPISSKLVPSALDGLP